MRFTETFQNFVCAGDTIDCSAKGFDVTARVIIDDCADRPDQRQDGFWPSLNPNDDGYIGPEKTKENLAEETLKAEHIMQGWEQDEWFYCGIILSVSRAGVTLDDHAASLWGIEANYPGSDNSYLTEAANELLPEAVDAGQTVLARLMTTKPTQRPDDVLFRRFHNNAAGWIGGVNNTPLIGQDGYSFSAIFDEDGSPVIIEKRALGETGSHQIMPPDPDFEMISTQLILLWDTVTLGG